MYINRALLLIVAVVKYPGTGTIVVVKYPSIFFVVKIWV